MIGFIVQALFFGTFLVISRLVFRTACIPGWETRAIVYGWGVFFLWALCWTILLPMSLKGTSYFAEVRDSLPDGQLAAGSLFGGWFWPAVLSWLASKRMARGSGAGPLG